MLHRTTSNQFAYIKEDCALTQPGRCCSSAEQPQCESLQCQGHPFYCTCRHGAPNTILHSPALISRRTDNVIMEVSGRRSQPGNSNYLQG